MEVHRGGGRSAPARLLERFLTGTVRKYLGEAKHPLS
jgi:hypothetical protein